jgi:hypothetical protein
MAELQKGYAFFVQFGLFDWPYSKREKGGEETRTNGWL